MKTTRLGIISTVVLSAMSYSVAHADGCLDYYLSYISQAEYAQQNNQPCPKPVGVVIVVHPGHDDGDHGHAGPPAPPPSGNNTTDNDVAIGVAAAAGAVAISASVSTTVEQQELDDAQAVANAIAQAQIGDGVDLRGLVQKVQGNPGAQAATEAQVTQLLLSDNASLAFCANGNLDSEKQLAAMIASQIAPPAAAN